MKYKSCTEYWLDTESCTFRGEFEEMYRDIDDPWGCEGGCLSLNNRIFLEMLFEKRRYRRILDIGCGLGGLTNCIAERNGGGEVMGCDVSETAVRKACATYPAIEFFCMNILESSPCVRGEFDLITCSEILWYVLDELEDVFGKLKKALSHDGVLGIHQYFPDEQKFGRDLVAGLEGFEKFMRLSAGWKSVSKVVSHVDDGRVLLSLYER